MINNLITHLKEEASEDAEHKGWCNTELTMNTQTRKEKTTIVEKLHVTVDELDASMENLAMKVAKLFAQVSHQLDNDPFVKVKKLVQDLTWKLQQEAQRRFLRKASMTPSCLSTDCSVVTTQQFVQRQVYKRKCSIRTSSAMRRRRQMKRPSRMCRTLNLA